MTLRDILVWGGAAAILIWYAARAKPADGYDVNNPADLTVYDYPW